MVTGVMEAVRRVNQQAVIVIKSTVPVGYTRHMADVYQDSRLLFSPEFGTDILTANKLDLTGQHA